MKKELGLCTSLLSLHLERSRSAGGFSRSISLCNTCRRPRGSPKQVSGTAKVHGSKQPSAPGTPSRPASTPAAKRLTAACDGSHGNKAHHRDGAVCYVVRRRSGKGQGWRKDRHFSARSPARSRQVAGAQKVACWPVGRLRQAINLLRVYSDPSPPGALPGVPAQVATLSGLTVLPPPNAPRGVAYRFEREASPTRIGRHARHSDR